MSKKLTGWYGSEQKPDRVGVYERRMGRSSKVTFSHWNGRRWGFTGFDANDAATGGKEKSAYQRLEWRGLAADPAKATPP